MVTRSNVSTWQSRNGTQPVSKVPTSVAFSVPMHTAMRLAVQAATRLRQDLGPTGPDRLLWALRGGGGRPHRECMSPIA